MAHFQGGNGFIKVRPKSERILKKTVFSNFKNTMENPVDAEEEAGLSRLVNKVAKSVGLGRSVNN